MQSSSTLKESFQNVCKYSELATNMFHYKITEQLNFTVLEFKPAELWLKVSPDTARQAVEQAMAGTLHIFHHLSGKKLFPQKVELTYRRPAPLVEYETIFNTQIVFNSKSNRLVFHSNDLQQPVLSYDQSLVALFDNLLRERINKFKKTTRLNDQVKQIILTEFKGQLPPIEIIASKLNMTIRTLQRRLSAEGMTFRGLTETIRSGLAVQLMKQEDVTGGEVARILGYSEASAFRRALKKWKSRNGVKL
jgi:AraC-like DNA-binding protein